MYADHIKARLRHGPGAGGAAGASSRLLWPGLAAALSVASRCICNCAICACSMSICCLNTCNPLQYQASALMAPMERGVTAPENPAGLLDLLESACLGGSSKFQAFLVLQNMLHMSQFAPKAPVAAALSAVQTFSFKLGHV